MNSYRIGWRRMESRMKNWRSLHHYTENILYTLYWKLKICTQRLYCSSSKFSKFRRSKWWPSLTFWYTSVIKSEAAYVIRRLTSRCLESKQPSRVAGSPLCDAVSSFLCHTHTDGKDNLLEWPDRSCLLLYVSARHPLKHSLAESKKTAKKNLL